MEEKDVKQENTKQDIGAFFARVWTFLQTNFPKWVWVVPPLIVAAAMLVFFKTNALFPFGSKTIAWCDMQQQVIPLLLDFKDILLGKEGFFFSFKNAGGMNFFGVFFFFLSSPFSLLVLFVDKTDMAAFANILVLLKMCVIAWMASIYLARKFPQAPLLNVAFSVLYAYSGYTMMYYQNVIWLDIVYLFPLLLMGLEELQTGKRTLFLIALTASMIVNYYLGYILVVFLLLYALVWCILAKDKAFAGNFLICCGVAALLSAVVWLPSLVQYFGSGRMVSLFESLSASSVFTPYETALPTVFSVAFLLPFAIGGLENAKKDGVLRGILLLATVLPLFFEPIAKMWQTGSYMSFPTRYAFVPIFLCITLALDGLTKKGVESAEEIDEKPKNDIPMYALNAFALLLSIGYCVFSVIYTKTHAQVMDQYSQSLWGNTESYQALLILYGVAFAVGVGLFILQRFPQVKAWVAWIALAAVAMTELYIAPTTYMRTPSRETQNYQNILALSDRIPDDGFYRVKTDKEYSSRAFDANLMGGLGYNALGHYTSLTSQRYMTAIKGFGYTSYWMEVGNSGGTILTDALLSVKYQISAKKMSADIYQTEQYAISQTPAALPLGIVTENDVIKSGKATLDFDRTALQKTLWQDFFGTENGVTVYALNDATCVNLTVQQRADGKFVFTPKQGETGALVFRVRVAEKSALYFDVFDENDNSLHQAINGKFRVSAPARAVSGYPAQKQNGFLYLGDYADRTFDVRVEVQEEVAVRSLGLATVSYSALSNQTQNAKTVGLKAVKNGLTGRYTADGGECVFLSVAYDEGMRLKINGKETPLYEVYGGFTAFYLQEGENAIELTFTPRGFAVGVVLTAVGILLCVAALALAILKKQRVELPESIQNIAYYGVIVVGGLAAVAVYVMPMLLALI